MKPRVAGAPISWGVCEVPGWGYQMEAERVLAEAAGLGLTALEAGPDGFLPREPGEAAGLLSGNGLGLVGGFVPVVLHEKEARSSELASVERQTRLLASAGAGVLVLAAATGDEGYAESADLNDDEWDELFTTLGMVEEIGDRHGLTVVLHPHYGTEIESPEQVLRFLEGCETGLCLDTGHSVVGGGDPVALAESAAERIEHVHLKDVDRELAERVTSGTLDYEEAVRNGLYRPLGDGDVDVGRVIEVLDRAGYDGWYVLEQDIMLEGEPGGGPAREVGESLAFVTEILESER
ncbi:Inosose dehydratase [uncultured Rubrobacteraceae bacterium]|uniref:Inosose dehydratase n=1 Tax=uncultured Rubrobacteraceae bacterium TaxID=349277 RepID=A0A6J4NU87_9ACTN|nr:Inosose dehydratase [uncultured Rubrobacteraceae bacterium]